jgi:hypothetical protein
MGVKLESLTLQEEHRLNVFNNSMLRNIFGTKLEMVKGNWN